jgi:predicted RecB family nuclease
MRQSEDQGVGDVHLEHISAVVYNYHLSDLTLASLIDRYGVCTELRDMGSEKEGQAHCKSTPSERG